MSLEQLPHLLRPYGLRVLGHTVDDGTLALIGPDEPDFWPIFESSAEYGDGSADPLDRWSRRVLDHVAAQVDGEALFPFGGPPYNPFYTWAVETGRAWPSPIGFLVHETAGLYVSFRGAIRLIASVAADTGAVRPCDSCVRPCQTACPVGAFDNGYDVAACKTHVASPEGHVCRTQGCRARAACPVGQGLRRPEQAAFHMEAFL